MICETGIDDAMVTSGGEYWRRGKPTTLSSRRSACVARLATEANGRRRRESGPRRSLQANHRVPYDKDGET